MEEEFDLLCEAITNEGEAKRGGVSYMYVSDNTIYRFEDGKMKKVAAKLIKKAQNSLKQPTQSPKQSPKQNKQKQQSTDESTTEQPTDESTTEEQPTDESTEEQQQTPQPKRKNVRNQNPTPKPPKIPSSNINIDEYYNNKYKLSYMEQEIDRLNGKITKLKHYKQLFNRIGGNTNEEIDELPTQKQPPQVQQVQQPEREQTQRRTDLFMF